MTSKITQARPEHEVVYTDLVQLVGRHAASMSGLELLAVAANMVGKLIAMQDQKLVSSGLAMEIVRHNIELGNQQVLDQLNNPKGSA